MKNKFFPNCYSFSSFYLYFPPLCLEKIGTEWKPWEILLTFGFSLWRERQKKMRKKRNLIKKKFFHGYGFSYRNLCCWILQKVNSNFDASLLSRFVWSIFLWNMTSEWQNKRLIGRKLLFNLGKLGKCEFSTLVEGKHHVVLRWREIYDSF